MPAGPINRSARRSHELKSAKVHVNPTTIKASRSDLFSKYPRASSSSIRFSTSMYHQLVSSHGPDGSRTRVWAPDLTHPRSTAVSCPAVREDDVIGPPLLGS